MYSDTLLRVKMESVKIKKISYGFTLDNLKQKNHTFDFYTFNFYTIDKVSEYINATIVSTLLNSSLK